MKQRLLRSLVRQFGQPHGLAGRLVGWSMAVRTSNVQRSRWAVDLLDLQPTDHVLEVGCGPGVALAHAARRTEHVVGVDASDVMVRQARRRSGAEVHHASVDQLPRFDHPFDKVLAVNTLGHWPEPIDGLRKVRAAMRIGGTIAVASQPRCPGATAAHSSAAAEELERQLKEAGYSDVWIETLALEPPAVCALARA